MYKTQICTFFYTNLVYGLYKLVWRSPLAVNTGDNFLKPVNIANEWATSTMQSQNPAANKDDNFDHAIPKHSNCGDMWES